MKYLASLLLLVGLVGCKTSHAQVQINGDFEKIDPATQLPVGWTHPITMEKNYRYAIDSVVKQSGKYSFSITKFNGDSTVWGATAHLLPYQFKGKEVELRGYIKTDNVIGGFAGLWLRVDGTGKWDGTLAFNNMADQNIHGTTDWKEYSIKLPYNAANATNVYIGALLTGGGKAWFDNMQLFIDGTPVENIVLPKAELDTAFMNNSHVSHAELNAQQIQNLNMLGQVWGFIKYYHPAVADTLFNMDAELFRVMPAVLKANNNTELSGALEQWVDKFGVPKACTDCKPFTGNDVQLQPDYGQLFDHSVLSTALTTKLTYILNNRNNTHINAYVDMVWGVGNPIFYEKAYINMVYPDAGYRLLCLYRYWNMINYFYPYRYLIGEDWSNVLPRFIPQFMNDTDAQGYSITTLAMIASIHDTHAGIWSYNKALETFRGKYSPPFVARFVGDQLVVTSIYKDTLGVRDKFKVGDVITTINGVSVADLIRKYLPVTPASNYTTQLRDMPRSNLMRSNQIHFEFDLLRDGHKLTQSIDGMESYKVSYAANYNANPSGTGFYLIDKNIGYLYPAKYHNKDLPEIEKLFKDTKGIIIDMRCYPSEGLNYFAAFIKSGNAPFAKFSSGRVAEPGLFLVGGTQTVTPESNNYKGKVIIIVNEQTQSAAEYATMAFQSSPNVTVIGSTTAGADGNVSTIILPGNISSYISGINVLYPDGTDTQRKGVKIDIVVKPTINGIKAGRDEPLEKAKQLILSSSGR